MKVVMNVRSPVGKKLQELEGTYLEGTLQN